MNVSEALKAKGYKKGDEINGPDDKKYVVGFERGRPPAWLMVMLGLETNRTVSETKESIHIEEKVITRILKQGRYLIGGQYYYIGPDAEIHFTKDTEVERCS